LNQNKPNKREEKSLHKYNEGKETPREEPPVKPSPIKDVKER